ncbi:hypothetical protein AAHA92_24432 [Salvia divinorum]|uniref:Uncharacterized protein n=1 Tax=Salvia divinorum TaxID=28513 RepID=A0ABD1G7B8_SALDI
MESRKAHLNLSMSRRTRKAQTEQKKSYACECDERENQKSLKQFMEGRCSLAQHFREEEEEEKKKKVVAVVVVRPPYEDGDGDGDGDERLRPKKSMVRNYAQLLRHLIKVKQDSYLIRSWRKSALSLKLINHK